MSVVAFGSVRSCGVTTMASDRGHLAGRSTCRALGVGPGGRHLGRELGMADRTRVGDPGRGMSAGLGIPHSCGSTANACPEVTRSWPRLRVRTDAQRPRNVDLASAHLGELEADVLVDCGRLDFTAPDTSVLEECSSHRAGRTTASGRPARLGHLGRNPSLERFRW